MSIPPSIQAGLWGLLAGSALLVGAGLGWFVRLPQRLIAAVMAFGSGTLIATLAFDLLDGAYRRGGFNPVAAGFMTGAAIYTAANVYLSRRGAKHRKRSNDHQRDESERHGAESSGLAIAVGAALDGIPESIVIGTSLIHGGAVGVVAVAAVFVSNIPEGLSSSAGMRRSGRSARYVFGIWGVIAAMSGLAALVGYVAFRHASPAMIAATTALAAGAILAMVSDTMIPEAVEYAHEYTGLITVGGFLAAFMLTRAHG